MTDDTRARELLAAEDETTTHAETESRADYIRRGGNPIIPTSQALRAITRALASPQDVGVERAALERIRKFSSAIERGEEPWVEGVQEITRMAMAALASAPAQPEQEDYRTGFRHGQAYESARIPAAQPVDED